MASGEFIHTRVCAPRLLLATRHASRVTLPAFTLIEMLTTVALLVIVLGLMVDLARYVRRTSADQLTRQVLGRLDDVADEYLAENPKGLGGVRRLLDGNAADLPTETQLRQNAERNNEDFVRILKSGIIRRDPKAGDKPGDDVAGSRDLFGDLPISLYNEAALRDAWGNPIVYMPDMHRAIGMAPRVRQSFFFSAGPDGKYLTRDDNLYSYESAK